MNNYDQMIEVLTAAKNREPVEYAVHGRDDWDLIGHEHFFNFDEFNYRIAPKKEMTLVEELRSYPRDGDDVRQRAADRIEHLEESLNHALEYSTTDELMDELKRRIK